MILVVGNRSLDVIESKLKEKNYGAIFYNNYIESDDTFEENIKHLDKLLNIMKDNGCTNLIFQSTADIYEQSNEMLTETSPIMPITEYSKVMLELENSIKSKEWLKSIIFRVTNIIDKNHDFIIDIKKAIYEDVPYEIQKNGYPVRRMNPLDKTYVRDYVDIEDVKQAVALAEDYFNHIEHTALFNIGTGYGYSEYEMIQIASLIVKRAIPFEIFNENINIPSSIYVNNSKAKQLLYWKPKTTTATLSKYILR